jgi:AraC-like DNA-binding protein
VNGLDITNSILDFMVAENVLIPHIDTFYMRTFEPGHSYEDHSYDDMVEIVMVVSGSSYIYIDGQCIKVKKDECLVILPGTVHNFFLKRNASCRIIDLIFHPGRMPSPGNAMEHYNELRFLYELQAAQIRYFHFVDTSPVRNTLERMYNQFKNCSSNSGLLLKLYYLEMIFLLSVVLCDLGNTVPKTRNMHITKALQFLSNFYGNKIVLEDVASYTGVTQRHLSRLFVKELGMTVQEYLAVLRMNKAMELLSNTDMNITGIALNTGFNTSQYFTTCFKRMQHISPREYRHSVK